MKKEISAKVFRFDPLKEEEPRYIEYSVEVEEGARVLHVLHAIQSIHDPSLQYRYCCGSGQCGSCAVRVNGEPVLACMEEAKDGMTIEPLNLPLVKDLIVDLPQFLNTLPCLVPEGEGEVPLPDVTSEIKPLRSCIGCLACVSVCPAMQVAEFAGPTAMRQAMRLTLDPRDKEERVSSSVRDGLFTCTTCQGCYKACPKEIAIPGKAIEKLRALAHEKGLTLDRHLEVAALIRETGRSVASSNPGFLDKVANVIEPCGDVRGTVGFFVGCMYNLRLPQTAFDAMEVLKRNGIRIIIPNEQVCCGSPLIRTGQTEFLPALKARNIESFVAKKIDIVMTMCAGCGSTLKHDYNTPFKVMDISEVLTTYGFELPAQLGIKVTYHDPCHLMRGQGVHEEPRRIIRACADLAEIPQVCCGAGGGVRSGLPEEAALLALNRKKLIDTTGADMVISSCPFCEFHLAEHTKKEIMNISSLLLRAYNEKDLNKPG